MSEVVENVPAVPTPEVVHKGVYTLWQNPDGGLRIQYRRDDKEQDDFFQLPGAMVRMAKAASEGNMNPIEMIKEVTKMMMNGSIQQQ
jgi:hypothetical protein